RAELHKAIDNDALTRLHARGDDPVVAGPLARLHRPRLGGALLVDHVDELSLRALEHRALRHGEGVGPGRAVQDHAHELSGAQGAVGIGNLGARLARAGRWRDADVGERELAFLRVDAAVGQTQLHFEILRQVEAASFGLLLQAPLLVVRDAEVYFFWIDLDHRGEQ